MIKALILIVAVMVLSGGVCPEQKLQYSNGDLQKMYDAYNDSYFNGNLPEAPVYWVDIPKDGDEYIMGNTYENITSKTYFIEIDTKSNITSMTYDLTLLHEMCHVATMDAMVNKYGETQHGPHFQKCMLQLAENGAFNNLW
jgi:hypothetical protein